MRAAGSVFQDGDTPELFMSNFQKFLFSFSFFKKRGRHLQLSLSRFIINNDTFRAEQWIEEVDTKVCDFVEDVVNLRFELGVESSAMETELVRGVAHAQLLKLQNSGQFPDEPLSRG